MTIQFSSGTVNEELLRVPIAAPGELTPQSMVHITMATNPSAADNDPTVGITDGVNSNQFILIEDGRSLTGTYHPCQIASGSQNGKSGPLGNPVAGGYTLLFDPSH